MKYVSEGVETLKGLRASIKWQVNDVFSSVDFTIPSFLMIERPWHSFYCTQLLAYLVIANSPTSRKWTDLYDDILLTLFMAVCKLSWPWTFCRQLGFNMFIKWSAFVSPLLLHSIKRRLRLQQKQSINKEHYFVASVKTQRFVLINSLIKKFKKVFILCLQKCTTVFQPYILPNKKFIINIDLLKLV